MKRSVQKKNFDLEPKMERVFYLRLAEKELARIGLNLLHPNWLKLLGFLMQFTI